MKQIAAIFALVMFTSASSFADIEVFCDASVSECVTKTTDGLLKLNCRLDGVTCEEVTVDGVQSVACAAISENCSEPFAELFGFTSAATKCHGSEKKSLKAADTSLYLTWTMGMMGGYVRDICVAE